MSDVKGEQKPQSPLGEIVQPFVDLIRAPRALWGINLAYVIEGMVYFGMLGYLAMHFSDFVFQGVEHADEHSHRMVMIQTAGITIAMFFLGFVADRRGVRFALIAAFVFMLVGRSLMSGAPNVLGLEPPRPGVLAGDTVTLHVTEVDTRDGDKTITNAILIANNEGGPDAKPGFNLPDLSAGRGIAPSAELDSRLVRLGEATIVEGDGQEWTIQYGTAPVTAQLLIATAQDLSLRPGATISLDRAYVARRRREAVDLGVLSKIAALLGKWFGDQDTLPKGVKREDENEFIIGFRDETDVRDRTEAEDEFVIRSHWLEDVTAVDTFPTDLAAGNGVALNASHTSRFVRLSQARIVKGEGQTWLVEYGDTPVTGQWFNRAPEDLGLCDGAIFSLNRARVTKEEDIDFALRFDWRRDMVILDTSGCKATPSSVQTITRKIIPDLSVGNGVPLDVFLKQKGSGWDTEVQLGEALVVEGKGHEWVVQYGHGAVRAPLRAESVRDIGLCIGAKVSLGRADVVRQDRAGQAGLRARWPQDIRAANTYGCEEPPYATMQTARETALRSTSRLPVSAPGPAAAEGRRVSIRELQQLEDGPVNVVLSDVQVAYVRNGGYSLQSKADSPAIFAYVNPLWSPLHLVTILGILLVVIGYGMYQPAAYAGVRQFTTPKTAAMGFAMLYALMNLGGWIPTFAFLLRDEDFLNLGIPGTYWVYTSFTLIALVATAIILSKKTVADAITTAKAQTATIKAAEAGEKAGEGAAKAEQGTAGAAPAVAPGIIPLHMWLFVLLVLVAICFRVSAPLNYTIAMIGAVAWMTLALVPPTRRWVARHPLANGKFCFFIFALIPVQTLFTYNWLILPQYISRAFTGVIGNYFEIASNANPILIFIAVPIITALTQKAKVYNMMIYGTFVMAAPAFLLTMGPHAVTLFAYILIMTIGEAMWQPRFLQYAAEIAPEGRTGEYMGVAQLPWFLTKVLVPWLYSGWMMDRYCPTEGPKSTEFMWLVFGCIAITSTIFLMLAKRWVGRDFKTKAE